MSYASARPLDPLLWLGLPALQAIGLTILFAIPLRLWGVQLPEPVFPMALTFAWVVIRPSVMAPVVTLLLGIFLDLFWGAPLGFWALALLLGCGVALTARSMMVGQSGAILWAWYAAICGVSFGAAFLFTLWDAGAAPSLLAVAWQYLATILLYPIAHRLIERFEDADVRFR